MTDREAMKLALEALEMADELCYGHGVDFKEYGLEFDSDIKRKYEESITALRERLAQPEQEPLQFKCTVIDDAHPNGVPLSQWGKQPEQEPAQRTWVGLTDEERNVINRHNVYVSDLIGATEAKLKEKNNG